MPNDITDFQFDRITDRRNTGSEKWDKYRDRDILPLWVADMDFPSPPAVIKGLHRRTDHGIFGYTHAPQELVETVTEHLLRDFGWRIEPQWLVWLPGLVCGLNVACRAVGEPGDKVATFIPVYPPFMTAPRNSCREVVKVPLQEENGNWRPDAEALNNALTERTKLFLLCNPHNPVGRVFTEKELAELAEVALRRDIIICSDEIHAGLILDPDKRHVPLARLAPEIADRTITLMAPSKTYNIPGLGCSFAVISNPVLRKAFQRVMAGIVPHVNALGYTAAEAAYSEGEEWRRALIGYLRENRDLVAREVNLIPGLAANLPEATYLSWIDARYSGLADPVRFFEEAGVGLSNGADFGAEGFLRLNFGCPRPLLQKALQRMAKAMNL